MAFNLYEFENIELCEKSLIDFIFDFSKQSIKEKNFVNLAFSGGKSPISLFKKLSNLDLVWEKCNISLVDERIVPENHTDSNAGLIKKYLLQNKAKLAKFDALLKNFSEKFDYTHLVKLANDSYNNPDLAVLGMGLDGHIASLFAKAKEFQNALICSENIVFVNPIEAPYKRLSMSLNALESCSKLILFIVGENKKKVFDKASLKENFDFPVSFILHSRKVVCDVYYSK